jgi:ABC-2 type transport system ATP-binding protein
MTVLKVEDLFSGYERKPIIKGITFELYKNEILGIIGSNGAGKTTLLKTLLGIIPYSKGGVYIENQELKDNLFAAKKSIAYIPEVPILYGEMTLREHMEFTAMAHVFPWSN